MVCHCVMVAIFMPFSVVKFCRDLLAFTITTNRGKFPFLFSDEQSYSYDVKTENRLKNSIDNNKNGAGFHSRPIAHLFVINFQFFISQKLIASSNRRLLMKDRKLSSFSLPL